MKQRPLTLAFLSNLYPPYAVGGNELFTENVVTALRSRGHQVHVLTGQGQAFAGDPYLHQVLNLELAHKEDIFLGGLPMTTARLAQWHLFSPTAYRQVLATLQRVQPDLVVAANLYMASAAPLLAARRLACPLVVQPMDKWLVYLLRDINQLVPGNTLRHRAALRLIKTGLQPLFYHWGKPDYILAVSEFIRDYHTAAGFSAAHSQAIYLGIPVARYPYSSHPYPANRPWRLLFAGQLWEGKGPQVAIEAVSRLRNQLHLPQVELNIYGAGTARFVDHLRALIEAYGLAPHVQLRGLIPRDQLAGEFQTHDLFLFCSIWDEPFSIVLQEALASGIPTIATTAGGTPEGVRQRETGLLVPPGDPQALATAIATLMTDQQLYETLGPTAGAYTRAHYDFDHFIDRLELLYQQIVAQYQPGRPPLPLAQLREK